MAENFALVFMFQNDKVDFSYNRLADPKFSFYDNTLVEAVKSEDHLVYLFFLCLSLCHTVMSEEKVEGKHRPEPCGLRLCSRLRAGWRWGGTICSEQSKLRKNFPTSEYWPAVEQ